MTLDHSTRRNNEGVSLAREGKTEDAKACFRKAIELQPDFAEAYVNLGIASERTGDFAEAERCYGRALVIEPLNPAGHLNLGIVFEKQGKMNDAIRRYRLLLDLRPELAEGHFRLGRLLAGLNVWPEAEAALREAARLEPTHAKAHFHWVICLQKLGRLCEAEAELRNVLTRIQHPNEDASTASEPNVSRPAVTPNERSSLCNELATVLLQLGRAEEAVRCFRDAVETSAANAALHSNLIYAMHYSATFSAASIYAEACEWARRHGNNHAKQIDRDPQESLLQSPNPAGRLRIGYIAPDLRKHPTRFFLEPVLEHHDRSRFEIFVYAESTGDDEILRPLSSKIDHWRAIGGLTDAQVAETVRHDRIDLLVDLMGHSGWNRLGVVTRQPAAFQMTWIGYPGTTGLPQIGWRITSEIADPPGSEALNTEQLIRLPQTFLCYKPSDYSPQVNDLPALANGYVTFGCLNNPCKITNEVIETWAKILVIIPTSRVMVLFNGGETEKALTQQRFAALGIGGDRLIPISRVPSRQQYLQLYQQIDIGLDPFPYNGCTTSCDSLWMGVPIVTLSGDTTVSRVGKMLVENLGLGNLAASTSEQYMQIARQLANDLPGLAGLRLGLRAMMATSPLCDGKRFTTELETALERIAERHSVLHLDGTA